MNNAISDEWREAMRPLASLLSKSEKAQTKLTPGTWQHRRLQENVRALHIASALMCGTGRADAATREELEAALRAFADMTKRSEKALANFAPGTSHATLQRNRLRAFRTAESLINAASKGS